MARKKKQSTNHLEVQNAAKTLFANIRFMSVDSPIRSIVITSAVPGEGKTTVAVYLAQAIATATQRVLLVEMDMRRRNLAAKLDIQRTSAGLHAVLTEAANLNAAVTNTKIPNLFFLNAEPSIPNPADLIASKRFEQLSQKLLDYYDYVIYDTPPVGTFIDAAILSTLADATVLVVRPNRVKRSQMLEAYEQLNKADANVIGVCANDVGGTGSEYYYAYYKRDGKRVRQRDEAVDELLAMPGDKPNVRPIDIPSVSPQVQPGRASRKQSRTVQPGRASRKQSRTVRMKHGADR